ncbi:hypothetical protein Q1695_015569 [Nippostrongylus brasiliensis]|nr:hypothetical protein Q1695_015569 [Nippostrongylus brasiliensis]
MSSSLLTASPSTQSTPSSSKQPTFDDACFKTPLPFKKPRGRGRGAASTANAGGVRPNGYHSTGSGRGRGVGRPPIRVVAPAPPPPPPKFVLHDVVCPHTAAYLGALGLPKHASVQPDGDDKGEDCDREKPSTSKVVKEEIVDDEKHEPESGSSVILMENGECGAVKKKENEENKENGSAKSTNGSKEAAEDDVDKKDILTNKLPFVEETILDEFSLLLFTCLSDAQVFEKELEALRAREEIEKKRLASEKAARIEKLKRKIRCKKRSIEKAARLQRKRLRGQNREKQRRERKSRHNQLKKTIRDAKALQKAAAAAGRVAVVDKELKRQWKAAQEAASLRREEKARKRAEHETRKEARRAKRDKKRGRKRRDPSKSKKAKDASNTSSAAAASAAAASTGSTVTASIAVANSTASAIVGTLRRLDAISLPNHPPTSKKAADVPYSPKKLWNEKSCPKIFEGDWKMFINLDISETPFFHHKSGS